MIWLRKQEATSHDFVACLFRFVFLRRASFTFLFEEREVCKEYRFKDICLIHEGNRLSKQASSFDMNIARDRKLTLKGKLEM
jgi:hypothetical protein